MPKKPAGLGEIETKQEEPDFTPEELYDLASPAQARKKLYQARSPSNRELQVPDDLKLLIDKLGFDDWWDNPVSAAYLKYCITDGVVAHTFCLVVTLLYAPRVRSLRSLQCTTAVEVSRGTANARRCFTTRLYGDLGLPP